MTPTHPPDHRHAPVPLWRDIRFLRVAGQVIVVVVLVTVLGYLFNNLVTNMNRNGMTFGFNFLNVTAGFDIGEGLVPYRSTDTYGQALLVGYVNTVYISVVGIVLSTILGVVIGVARLSPNWLVNKITAGYVEIFRNTPLLVQLFLIWAVMLQLPSFAESIELPGSIYLNNRGLVVPAAEASGTFAPWFIALLVAIAIGIAGWRISARREAAGRPTGGAGKVGLAVLIGVPVLVWFLVGQAPVDLVPATQGRFNFEGGTAYTVGFLSVLIGLVLYTAAFIGEVIRGGIQAVRRGQLEAAHALGLSDMQTLRLVIFPQAMRVIIPPLTSQYLNLAKNSSLAIAIGYPDLFSVTRTMANQTGQPISVVVIVMAAYLSISLTLSFVMNVINRRVQVLER